MLYVFVAAAVDPRAEPSYNTYLGPKYLVVGPPAVTVTNPMAHSEDKARVLWEESVKVVGKDFAFTK